MVHDDGLVLFIIIIIILIYILSLWLHSKRSISPSLPEIAILTNPSLSSHSINYFSWRMTRTLAR